MTFKTFRQKESSLKYDSATMDIEYIKVLDHAGNITSQTPMISTDGNKRYIVVRLKETELDIWLIMAATLLIIVSLQMVLFTYIRAMNTLPGISNFVFLIGIGIFVGRRFDKNKRATGSVFKSRPLRSVILDGEVD